MSRRSADGALFVGRLGKNCRVRDLEDVFEPYGRLSRCEIKYGAEMAYAFVDYEDRRDAEDAIKYENGRDIAGSAIIVEWAKGTPRRGGGGPPPRDIRGGGRTTDECYRCRRSGHWARDCPDDNSFGYRRPSRRSRSRSPRRRSYRSRSRSRSRDRRRSRSRSHDRRRRRRSTRSHSDDRKRSRSRSRSHSRSRSRSRSRSADEKEQNGKASRSRSRSPEKERSASP